MKLHEDDSVIKCFKDFGDDSIPTELVNGELPQTIRSLEQFVCQVYLPSGPKTLPALRW